jgi:hypothetical protein
MSLIEVRDIYKSEITDDLEKEGHYLYQNNEFLRLLSNTLEHPETKSLLDNFCKDLIDMKTLLMFMAIYKKCGDANLTPYQKIALTKRIIDNEGARKNLCNIFSNIITNKRIK